MVNITEVNAKLEKLMMESNEKWNEIFKMRDEGREKMKEVTNSHKEVIIFLKIQSVA